MLSIIYFLFIFTLIPVFESKNNIENILYAYQNPLNMRFKHYNINDRQIVATKLQDYYYDRWGAVSLQSFNQLLLHSYYWKQIAYYNSTSDVPNGGFVDIPHKVGIKKVLPDELGNYTLGVISAFKETVNNLTLKFTSAYKKFNEHEVVESHSFSGSYKLPAIIRDIYVYQKVYRFVYKNIGFYADCYRNYLVLSKEPFVADNDLCSLPDANFEIESTEYLITVRPVNGVGDEVLEPSDVLEKWNWPVYLGRRWLWPKTVIEYCRNYKITDELLRLTSYVQQRECRENLHNPLFSVINDKKNM